MYMKLLAHLDEFVLRRFHEQVEPFRLLDVKLYLLRQLFQFVLNQRILVGRTLGNPDNLLFTFRHRINHICYDMF